MKRNSTTLMKQLFLLLFAYVGDSKFDCFNKHMSVFQFFKNKHTIYIYKNIIFFSLSGKF